MGVYTDYSIKNASVKAALDGGILEEFGDSIDLVQLSTTFATTARTPVSGNNSSAVGSLTDTITLTLADDLKAGAFWLFLRENHGENIDVEFTPKVGGTAKIVATCTAVAPASFGGGQGYNASQAVLPCIGAATITPEA